MFDNFKHSDEGSKHFIGYKKGKIVKPLCIILPQMNGYIKYFKNDSKSCHFLLEIKLCWMNITKFEM